MTTRDGQRRYNTDENECFTIQHRPEMADLLDAFHRNRRGGRGLEDFFANHASQYGASADSHDMQDIMDMLESGDLEGFLEQYGDEDLRDLLEQYGIG